MAIPDYQTLMLPVLRIAAKGETRVPDVAERIGDEFKLTVEERDELLPSGRQRLLHNRVHWAKFYLGKAGLVTSTRRGWFLTSDAGKKVLTEKINRIDLKYLLHIPVFYDYYKAYLSQKPDLIDQDVPAVDVAARISPEEQIELAHAQLQSTLRDDLLRRILQNSPAFFERVVVELLVSMGYGGSHRNAAAQLGRSGDGGVDGVINEDSLGLDRVYVQAKRYEQTVVGRPDVQSFVGSLVGLGATKGVFVATSSFSQQAIDYVRHLQQRVILIDGRRLTDLMVEHNVGVRVNRAIEFKRIDEDFFSEDE